MILEELKQLASTDDGIKGKLAAELNDITEQYQEGVFTKEEYDELIKDIVTISNFDKLANDEETSRWLVKAAEALISVV